MLMPRPGHRVFYWWVPIATTRSLARLLPSAFWAEYPYFLPCLVIASFPLIQFTIVAIFFEETLGRKTSAISRPQESTSLQQDEEPAEQPLPLRARC
ncbi:hypothetical protein EDB84DRAFT_281418 [Lactarius hengduanensis]|nr:hypothetical protein EDB84DRAFT_281418 [Lactarius hengduanensis]